MKTIGLVGGMSWESTAEYYRIINQEMKRRLGGHRSAKLVLASVDFAPIAQMQIEEDWQGIGREMERGALAVAAAGADFVLFCTNTIHLTIPQFADRLPISVLHIADVTAKEILTRGQKRVGLLGTGYTMAKPFYRERMQEKFGIEVLVPEEGEQKVVHDCIMNELCHGTINPESKRAYIEVIRKLQTQGAQSVILGCTEIPLLIEESDVSLPLINTTELHARAAVDEALLKL